MDTLTIAEELLRKSNAERKNLQRALMACKGFAENVGVDEDPAWALQSICMVVGTALSGTDYWS